MRSQKFATAQGEHPLLLDLHQAVHPQGARSCALHPRLTLHAPSGSADAPNRHSTLDGIRAQPKAPTRRRHPPASLLNSQTATLRKPHGLLCAFA